MATPIPFILSTNAFQRISLQYPNLGKNSDVGGAAVEIVQEYFLSNNAAVQFGKGVKGSDLQVTINGISTSYEIKGTADCDIQFAKLKVSSTHSYNALVGGLALIRVCNVGRIDPTLFFLKYGVDFDLVPEPRWQVKKI
jgi:hypothetical protein